MKKNLLNEVEEVLLMGPGPSSVPESVYRALSTKTISHLDPYFIIIMDDLKSLLRKLCKTDNKITFPISGTGSAGMETCFVNLIEKGDNILVLKNGVFGDRMEEVATRLGANVDSIGYEWGKPVIFDDVKNKFESKEYKIVAMVHAETSTGVLNPVKEVGKLTKNSNSLFLVDAVVSLGGMDVQVDDWCIDAMYSGSQKCISCPPGLAPVSFSNRAVNTILNRRSKVPNWYLDISMILSLWDGNKRVYHYTAPVNMIYGLYQAVWNIMEEGLETVFNRHSNSQELLIEGLTNLGFELFVDEHHRLPMVTVVNVPEGLYEGRIRDKLRSECKIEIGAGLGSMAGKVWRIGLMGHTAREENVERLLKCLKNFL